MIFPCIDLMDGQAVQLVQGRKKALDAGPPEAMLEKFKAFPEIQVIDLDAAMGRGSNDEAMRRLAARAAIRAGGGVRTIERALTLVEQGARKVIVGTAAFGAAGIDADFLTGLREAIERERVIVALDSREGRIVVKGWQEATALAAEDVLGALEPYCAGFLCTYVDKEGMMQGTDLEWFRRLRAATPLELTAAGGVTTMEEVRALAGMGVNVAVGMAMYTGRLGVDELARV
jgi:phosphoribosylformimino-5-aminoimidazole carboxamide ribotide isomerase